MTFTEAAEAVLRKTGKPLHYKKITQFAIEQNLLSHVGKTPEVTMSTRLATLAKKDRGEAPIVRIKPGVFGLRDWGEAAVAAAEDEPEGEEAPPDLEGDEEGEAASDEHVAARPVGSPEEVERAQRVAAGAQLFPVEDDDDEPVLGEKPAPAAVPGAVATTEGGAAQGEGGRRRRRRRRRGGRGGERDTGVGATSTGEGEGIDGVDEAGAGGEGEGDDDDIDLPGYTVEPMTRDLAHEVRAGNGEGHAAVNEDGGEPAPRHEPRRDGRRDAPRRDDVRRDDSRRDDSRRDEPREERDGIRLEETGRDAADLLVSLLTRRDDRQPVALRALVEDGIRSGRLNGEASLLASAFSAAARSDGARREARGERPRLRVSNGRVGLVDWSLGPELLRAEADALAALERLRDASRRLLVRRLNELPQSAFIEMTVLLLERLGVSSLRNTRRPGLPQGEVHLAGIARRGTEEIRTAVLIKRGGEIGRERVIELRGTLHHYGPALSAWIVTTGNVLSGAREEASQTNGDPVSLIDGATLGRLLDDNGVGVRHASVRIPYVDGELFDSLRTN